MPKVQALVWWKVFAVEYLANQENPAAAYLKAVPDVLHEEAEVQSRRLLEDARFTKVLQEAARMAAWAYRMTLEEWYNARLDVIKEDPKNLETIAKRRTLEIVGMASGFIPQKAPFAGQNMADGKPLSLENKSSGSQIDNTKPKGEFMENTNHSDGASRASKANFKRGRKKSLTPQRVKIILDAIANGHSEKAARLKGGVCSAVFYREKKNDPGFAQGVEEAQRLWADIRYKRHLKQVESARFQRGGHRKVKRPKPIYQANLVAWYLTYRVPLNISCISIAEEQQACEQYGIPWEMWCSQRDIFSLMAKVYQKRAKLRGEEDAPIRRRPRYAVERDYNPIESNGASVNGW